MNTNECYVPVNPKDELPKEKGFYYVDYEKETPNQIDLKQTIYFDGEHFRDDFDCETTPLFWLKKTTINAVGCMSEEVKDKVECLLGYLKTWGNPYDRPAPELPQVIAECEKWLEESAAPSPLIVTGIHISSCPPDISNNSEITPKQETKDDWISVKDKKPEIEESVLLYMAKQGDVNKPSSEYIGWLNADEETYSIRLGQRIDKDAECNPDFWVVTHWQPLPAPPIETNIIQP